jgi:hypothetical protein
MIKTNTEYFSAPYYFYILEKHDKVSLYYAIADTLLESRKIDEKIDINPKDLEKVKKGVSDIVKSKKFKTKEQIKKYFTPKSKDKEEMTEFVDDDGTMNTSKIPILDKSIMAKKTTDQTVVTGRMTNNPVTRGYRKYYGESEISNDNIVTEVDYSEAFGYEETKDMDGESTYKYLIDKLGMSPDEAVERTKQFGKDPYGNKTKHAPKEIRNKKGFIDRMTLSEKKREEMIKMVEDILLKNKYGEHELEEKEEKPVSKIVKKNAQVLKKMAEKEGITINQLIKMLKSE